MYVVIDEKVLDKTREDASAEANKEGLDSNLVWNALKDELETLEFKDGQFIVGISNKLGYFTVDFNIDLDTAIEIITYYLKRFQKIADAINSIKELKEG